MPKTITFRDAPYYIIKYMETKQPDIWEEMKARQQEGDFFLHTDVKRILGLMIKDNIAGHLLIAKIEELSYAINCLITNFII